VRDKTQLHELCVDELPIGVHFWQKRKKKHPSNNLQKQFFENEKLVTPTRNFSMPDFSILA
jgi:hypothetical protein